MVVYGVVGYKIYVKMLLVVCCDGEGIKCYVYVGIGNYYIKIIKIYIDYGLMMVEKGLCQDVYKIFQEFIGMGKVVCLKQLKYLLFILYLSLVQWIDFEIEQVLVGKLVCIIVKFNLFIEEQIMWVLYWVSQVGVQIDLIVCGICCLCSGIFGLLENICVCLVIGCFLEYMCIYYFYYVGEDLVYCFSVDWMDCNLFNWVEIVFLVNELVFKVQVLEQGLEYYLCDNGQVWELYGDGIYCCVQWVEYEVLFLVQQVLFEVLFGGV